MDPALIILSVCLLGCVSALVCILVFLASDLRKMDKASKAHTAFLEELHKMVNQHK